jgi:hypothetical protein
MSPTTVSRQVLFTFSLAILLSACNLPHPSAAGTATLTVTAQDTTCAFMEARQALPELSEQFTASLKEAGLPVEAARAEAYGENCVAGDNTVLRFTAKETDFYAGLNVANLADEAILGAYLEKILDIIDKVPTDQTGPNPGYIGVTFKAGDQLQNLWFLQTQSDDLRAQGLQGADLYRALKNEP